MGSDKDGEAFDLEQLANHGKTGNISRLNASRTIDRQHTQPPPTLLCDLLIGRIQQNIVQCDQCLGLKLLPGAAEGRFGYRGNGCWIIRDRFKKLFQFIPVGAFAEVQQQWDQPL